MSEKKKITVKKAAVPKAKPVQVAKGNLVQKPVQVQTQNGTTYTRMQWVDPDALPESGGAGDKYNGVKGYGRMVVDSFMKDNPGMKEELAQQQNQISELKKFHESNIQNALDHNDPKQADRQRREYARDLAKTEGNIKKYNVTKFNRWRKRTGN